MGIASAGEPWRIYAQLDVGAARTAYAERLSHRNDGNSDFARYVDNIENYNIGISASRNCYVVVFLLSDPRHEIDGGGAEYWIDKRTLGIVKAMGYK